MRRALAPGERDGTLTQRARARVRRRLGQQRVHVRLAARAGARTLLGLAHHALGPVDDVSQARSAHVPSLSLSLSGEFRGISLVALCVVMKNESPLSSKHASQAPRLPRETRQSVRDEAHVQIIAERSDARHRRKIHGSGLGLRSCSRSRRVNVERVDDGRLRINWPGLAPAESQRRRRARTRDGTHQQQPSLHIFLAGPRDLFC